jgi:hypothetical protein
MRLRRTRPEGPETPATFELSEEETSADLDAAQEVEPEVMPPPPPPSDDEASGPDLPPSAMQGSEEMWGYVVAAELLLASVLTYANRHAAGVSASQTQTWKYVAAFAASLALVPVIRLRRRMLAGFAAILAAFCVSLPPAPKSQALIHILALVIPLGYALLLTQRQRKATLARGGSSSPKRSRRTDRGETKSERRRSGKSPQPKQTASGRYTPPKAKRATPGRKQK